MRKSNVIPKIVVCAVLLIAAIVISAPVSSVMFNKILGGGTLDFNEAAAVEFRDNRPVEGNLYFILGCTGSDGGDDSGFTLKDGSYYYLAAVGGKSIDKENPQNLVLIKSAASSENYEIFNNLWRESSKGESDSGVELSGVLKSNSTEEESAISKLKESVNIGDLEIVSYYIDSTKSVSSISTRFYISLIFYAVWIVSLLLVIQGIKRNRNIDYIENERSIYRISQEVKSGNKNDDGSDAMFGDSERNLDEIPQTQGVSYGYPSPGEQQYQGNQYDESPRFSNPPSDSEDQYDGFFGG